MDLDLSADVGYWQRIFSTKLDAFYCVLDTEMHFSNEFAGSISFGSNIYPDPDEGNLAQKEFLYGVNGLFYIKPSGILRPYIILGIWGNYRFEKEEEQVPDNEFYVRCGGGLRIALIEVLNVRFGCSLYLPIVEGKEMTFLYTAGIGIHFNL